MAMVSNKFFGAVAIKLGFHRHLKHSTNMLIPQITEYALEIQQAQESAAGVMDYWMVTKDPPKVPLHKNYLKCLLLIVFSVCQILSKHTWAHCLLILSSTIEKWNGSSNYTFNRTSKI
jgi:hypothetical protein